MERKLKPPYTRVERAGFRCEPHANDQPWAAVAVPI